MKCQVRSCIGSQLCFWMTKIYIKHFICCKITHFHTPWKFNYKFETIKHCLNSRIDSATSMPGLAKFQTPILHWFIFRSGLVPNLKCPGAILLRLSQISLCSYFIKVMYSKVESYRWASSSGDWLFRWSFGI